MPPPERLEGDQPHSPYQIPLLESFLHATAMERTNEQSPTTPGPADHSAYLSALHQIDRIPVPDLASTLTSIPPETQDPAINENNRNAETMESVDDAGFLGPSIFSSANQLSERIRRMNAAMETRILNNSMGYQSRNWTSNSSTTATGTGARDEVRVAELMEQHRQRIARMTTTWRTLSSTAAAAGEPLPDAEERTSRLERVLQHVGYLQERTLEDAESHAQLTAQQQRQELQNQDNLARLRREAAERRAVIGETRRLIGSLTDRIGQSGSPSTTRARPLTLANRYSEERSRRYGSPNMDREWDDARRDNSASPPRSLSSHPTSSNRYRGNSGNNISARTAEAETTSDAQDRLSAVRNALDQMRRRNQRLASSMGMSSAYHRRREEYLEAMYRRREDLQRPESEEDMPALERPPARLRSTYHRSSSLQGTSGDYGTATSRLTPSASMARVSLTYLSNLRQATSEAEARECASAAGYGLKDIEGPSFILNLRELEKPQFTSMLAPGSTFTGSQYANTFPPDYLLPNFTTGNTMSYVFPSSSSRSASAGSSAYSSAYSSLSSMSSLAPTRAPPASYVPCPWPASVYQQRSGADGESYMDVGRANVGAPSSGADHWPVKVTIYEVDYDALTLSACMEAYDVPPPAGYSGLSSPTSSNTTPNTATFANAGQTTRPRSSSKEAIKTYVEGEIIDLWKYTLVTESFTSKVEDDIKYWSKLAPFKNVPLAELPAKLLDKEFLTHLMTDYVLMRLKERCFMHSGSSSTSSGSASYGLTISGFYYVVLKRASGMLEGLYCDPQANPHQYLMLGSSQRGQTTSWSFA